MSAKNLVLFVKSLYYINAEKKDFKNVPTRSNSLRSINLEAFRKATKIRKPNFEILKMTKFGNLATFEVIVYDYVQTAEIVTTTSLTQPIGTTLKSPRMIKRAQKALRTTQPVIFKEYVETIKNLGEAYAASKAES